MKWIKNAKLVLPDGVLSTAALCVSEGIIVEIVEGTVADDGLDVHGLSVLPGFVDMHGDMFERDIQPRPNANIPYDVALFELDKRLIGAGITTAYAAVSMAWSPEESLRSEGKSRAIMSTIHEMRSELLVDHRVHARFEITNPAAGDVLVELLNDNLVDMVSLMDHTPGQGQYRDIEKYIKWAIAWRKQTGQEATEDEIRAHIAERQARPRAWDAVNSVSKVAVREGLVLASHDDDTVEKVELMASTGVTLSEFPVSAEAAAAAHQQGMMVAMGAPNAFRGNSLNGNMSAYDAVLEGLVDILATDYYPAALLHATYKFASDGTLPLHESVKLVSANPAKAMGLNDRGELMVGKKADLIIVDETGRRPRVHGALRNGIPIYWDRYMRELTERQTRAVMSIF